MKYISRIKKYFSKFPRFHRIKRKLKPSTWKDEDWADALAFDMPVRNPLSTGTKSTSKNGGRKPQPRDPLHTLAKMRFDDSKLLGSGAAGAGDTDAFLRSAGTSRSAPKKRSIKRAK